MGFIINREITDVVSEAKRHTWALLYQISDIILCRTEDVKEEDWNECIEARFFRKDSEFHYLPEDNLAVTVADSKDENTDVVIQESEYEISGRFRAEGISSVTVRRYLRADEDGQLRVVLTRLMELK